MQIKRILTGILTGALMLALLGAFVGCADNITYENADEYTAGDFQTEEKISSVVIYWEGGEVLLKNTISSTLRASEERDATAVKMQYRIKDGVLSIYPCASGERVEAKKSLTLYLPYDYANTIETVSITTVGAAPVTVESAAAQKLTVVADAAPVIVKGRIGEVNVTTATGDLLIESQRAEKINFTSDKGNASISLQTNGFVAVMQGGGELTTEFDAHRDGNAYRYGNQSLAMIFDTRGDVALKNYKAK